MILTRAPDTATMAKIETTSMIPITMKIAPQILIR